MMTVLSRGTKTTGSRIMSQITPISSSAIASNAAAGAGVGVDLSRVSITAMRTQEEQYRLVNLQESKKKVYSSSQSTQISKARKRSPSPKKRERAPQPRESLGKANVLLTAEDLTQHALFFFTDGSCKGNQNVRKQACPAGWGVLAVRIGSQALPVIAERLSAVNEGRAVVNLPAQHVLMNSLLTEACCEVLASLRGPVIIEETGSLAPYSLGATLGSNNTAELTAIGEALLHFRDHLSSTVSPPPRHCVVLHDSEYAAKSILGEFNGNKNLKLIHRVRAIFLDIQRRLHEQFGDQSSVLFVKVKAHSGYTFNEMADTLAKRGAENVLPLAVGRYASVSSEVSL